MEWEKRPNFEEHKGDPTQLFYDRGHGVYLNEKRKEHPCKIDRFKHPERQKRPKGILRRIFQDVGRIYEDTRDAERIIKLADIDKLWRCSSFERFADKVVGVRRH